MRAFFFFVYFFFCQVYYLLAGYSWCLTGFNAGTYFQMATGVGTVLWAIQ